MPTLAPILIGPLIPYNASKITFLQWNLSGSSIYAQVKVQTNSEVFYELILSVQPHISKISPTTDPQLTLLSFTVEPNLSMPFSLRGFSSLAHFLHLSYTSTQKSPLPDLPDPLGFGLGNVRTTSSIIRLHTVLEFLCKTGGLAWFGWEN